MAIDNFYESWEQTGVNTLGKIAGVFYTTCPKCSHERKAKNQKKKCLLVDLDKKRFQCFNDGCEFEGWITKGKGKEYFRPEPLPKVEKPISDEWAKQFFKRGVSLDTLRKLNCQCVQYAFSEDIEYGENNKEIRRKSDAMVFPYQLKSDVLFYKYRGLKKQFSLSKQPQLIFWNLNCLYELNSGKWIEKKEVPYVIICEGEIDALSWIECGYENVLSVPNGATEKGASEEYIDRTIHLFEKVGVIYISVDNDKAGLKLREKLSRRFGKDRCKIVDYPYEIPNENGELKPAKDINDVLKHHDKAAVKACYDNATWHPIKGVKTLKDCNAALDSIYKNGREPFKKIGLDLDEYFTWNTGNALTAISARPQNAKSQLTFNVAIRLSYFYGMKWAVFSPETGEVDEIAQRLIELLTGGLLEKTNTWKLPQLSASHYQWAKQWVSEHFFFICESELEDLTFQNYLDTVEKMVYKYGINGAIADPVNMFEDMFGGNGEMMSKGLSTNLVAAKMSAKKHDIHHILVPHPVSLRGKDRMESSYDINGGAAWYNHSDNILLLNRQYGTGNYAILNGDNIEITIDKCKKAFAGRRGEVLLGYYIPTGAFGNIKPMQTTVFENCFIWEKAITQKRIEASKIDYFDNATSPITNNLNANTLSLSGEDIDNEIPF